MFHDMNHKNMSQNMYDKIGQNGNFDTKATSVHTHTHTHPHTRGHAPVQGLPFLA